MSKTRRTLGVLIYSFAFGLVFFLILRFGNIESEKARVFGVFAMLIFWAVSVAALIGIGIIRRETRQCLEPTLVICGKCGQHGRIILADGFVGTEIYSQAYATHMVVTGLEHERFSLSDATSLGFAIDRSTLPKEDSLVSERFKQAVTVWNEQHAAAARAEGNPNSDEDFHRFIASFDN